MRNELALCLGLLGCGADPPRDPPPPGIAAVPADSLVLALGGGAEVWLTRGREARSAAGAPCVERTLEIRRDTLRKSVPLLYALEPPVAIDDSTFRATLSRDCAAVGSYRVSATDGQPHRETP